MFRTSLRTITALTASALTFAAAPAAMAHSQNVGNSSGTPSANICLLDQACTYVSYKNGKPSDAVGHAGTLSAWTVNAGSTGGQVQLRILRPASGGNLKFVASSATQTVGHLGKNTFSAHIKVKAGDVLALTNSSSGEYMGSSNPTNTSVRYFSTGVTDGWSGKPDMKTPGLHLLLCASIH